MLLNKCVSFRRDKFEEYVKENEDVTSGIYQGADKSLARRERKQARKHAIHARDFSNIEARASIKFFFRCKARPRRKFTSF